MLDFMSKHLVYAGHFRPLSVKRRSEFIQCITDFYNIVSWKRLAVEEKRTKISASGERI